MKPIKSSWINEYEKKGIPSSFRKDPTQALVEFIAWYQKQPIQGSAVADIGAGQGRNSFYLHSQGFHVTTLELLEENVAFINEEAKRANMAIEAHAQDASDKWPLANHLLDIAVDIFCYKHIVDKRKQLDYRKELSRCLKPRGYFFISLASTGDGYYGPLLADSPDPGIHLIIDPQSDIPSLLYTRDSLIEEFSNGFTPIRVDEKLSTSPMYGKSYERRVLNAIFQKI